MSGEEPTCEGSVGPSAEDLLRDAPKKCCACGKVLSRSELKAHPDLCEQCSVDVDREYERRRDEDDLGWFSSE
jgi:hypothetical protein